MSSMQTVISSRPQRQQLINQWTKYFDSVTTGYWITLNTKFFFDEPKDYGVYDAVSDLNSEVGKYCHSLNRYCYGRRNERNDPNTRLSILSCYEIGSDDDIQLITTATYTRQKARKMLHAHLLVGHDGSTNRTTDEVLAFTVRKWATPYRILDPRYRRTAGWKKTAVHPGNTFVDVQHLGCIQGRIAYMTKQANEFQYGFGEHNLTLH